MIRVSAEVTGLNPRIVEDVQNAIISTLDRVSAAAQEVAIGAAPKDTGLLQNSIGIIRRYSPPIYVGGIATNVGYATVMEEGRRPGKFPPFLPIARWVIRNKAKFSSAIKKFGGGKKGTASLIFLIRRGIARRGIPSNPRFDSRGFFKKAEKAITKAFPKEIQALGLRIQTAWESGG